MKKISTIFILLSFVFANDVFSLCLPPNTPTSLKAITISKTKVYLSWTDNANNEDGFSIERSSTSASSGFTIITTVGSNITNYTSAGLTTNKRYWYRIRAYCSTSFSGYSNVAVIVTLPISVANITRPEFNRGMVNGCIDMSTGAFMYTHVDINIPTMGRPLKFQRYYNSKLVSYNNQMGNGWTHSYDYKITNLGDTIYNVHYGDGHECPFIAVGDGTATPAFGGTFENLVRAADRTYTLTFKNREVFMFDSTGVLQTITDRNGNVTTIAYISGKINTISTAGGRILNFFYVGSRISGITDRLGRFYQYSYTAGADLSTYTNPLAATNKHSYTATHLMTRVIDFRTDTVITNTYDLSSRIATQTDPYAHVTTLTYDNLPADTSSATLGNGAPMRFIHDSLYRMLIEFNELGDSTVYTYDFDFNIKTILDVANNTTYMTYDARGNLTQLNRPLSTTTRYTYNSSNDTTAIIDALNNTTTMNYDNNGNRTSVIDPLTNQKSFSYNPAGQVVSIFDFLGHQTSFTYDTSGNMLTRSNLLGTTLYNYDAVGRITAVTDPIGHTVNYTLDKNDKVTLYKDAMSLNINYVYDANSNLTEYRDRRNLSTFMVYDKINRLTSIQDPLNAMTAMTYTTSNKPFIYTDPTSTSTVYSYDAKNRLIGSSNTIGIKQYTFDVSGNLTSETDETFYKTTYTYDALNRLIKIADDLGDSTRYFFDALGNRTGIEDPRHLITSYQYDANRKLIRVLDPLGDSTRYEYDANGNMTAYVDPNGNRTMFSYNSADQLIGITDASAHTTSNTYDAKGNLLSRTEPDGNIAAYTYDADDRITRITYTPGDSSVFSYDANSNITAMGNANGTYTFSYNKANRPVIITDVYGNSITYAYNLAGYKTGITYPGSRTLGYTYDGLHNLTQVTDWLGHVTGYTYDDAGRILTVTYPNGTKCNYLYDNAGRLTRSNNKFANNNFINRNNYTLDAAGYKIAEDRVEPLATILSPLINNYTYLPDNRLKTGGATNYAVNGNGHRVSETGINPATYTWTASNLLASVSRGTQAPITFKYNAAGNRIQKQQGTNTTRYLLDLTQEFAPVIEEHDSAGGIKATNIYGTGLISRIDSAGHINYYHYDGADNTVAMSDSIGQLTNTYAYEPFGELLSHSGTSSQPFLHKGRQGMMMEGNNLYYFRSAFYDATTGRMLNKSPRPAIEENPQDLNSFIYSLNDPHRIPDPRWNYGRKDDGGYARAFSKIQNWLNNNSNSGK